MVVSKTMVHKTLNRIDENAAAIQTNVETLNATVAALPETMGTMQSNMFSNLLEGQSNDFNIDALSSDQLVSERNKIQSMKAVLQGQSNLIQKRLDDEKLEQKLSKKKPEDIEKAKAVYAEMIVAKEASFMRMQAVKEKEAAKKVEAAEKKAAAKKAAAEKKAAKAVKKRKASSLDPEVLAIEAETDAALELIEYGVLPMA